MRQIKQNIKIKGENLPSEESIIRVLKLIYKNIPDNVLENKLTTISITFYTEDFENNDNEIIKFVFRFLKKEKYLKEYHLLSNGLKEVIEEGGISNDGKYEIPYSNTEVFFINYKCEFIPSKIKNFLIELSVSPKYFVSLEKYKMRDVIILNDKYILSNPRYDGQALNFFEVVLRNPETKLTKSFIEKDIMKTNQELNYKLTRRILGMIEDLGFKKMLRKIFFTNISKNALFFRNNVLASQLENEEINYKKLMEEIKQLKHFVKKPK